jgi:hypothetical protein
MHEMLAMAKRRNASIDENGRSGENQSDRPQDEFPNEREHCLDDRTEKRLDHVAIGERLSPSNETEISRGRGW